MMTPEILKWITKQLARMQKKRTGGCIGDPNRFDEAFALHIQMKVVRAAERKRARKARLRRLTRAA
ncbi:MAG TPA: hypothetical protein VN921_01315 [Chthoniobacterales bacterium]|nr:hypothetical protein [Chthoniobacterales bacterium]